MSISTISKLSDTVEEAELEEFKHWNKVKEKSANEDELVRITYDEALLKYGNGKYQIILFTLMSLITWSTVFNNNGYIFIGAYQEHTCMLPESGFNRTGSDVVNNSATIKYELGKCTYNTTAVYEDNTTIVIEKDVKCSSWNYDQSLFSLTMISEWDLNSCNGIWYTTVGNSLFMLGFLIGCIMLADLSDRYGRSLLLVISNVAMVIFGIVAAFSVNFYMLIAMRFFLGIFTAGARNASFVYVCEVVTFRDSAGMLTGVVYCIGGIVVTAISHLLPNWRHFQLACALFYCLFIPLYWILPESPRWNLNQGNTEPAIEFFRKSARINGLSLPKNFQVYIDSQPTSGGNVFTLFRTPNVRKKTLVVCILWFSVSLVFFGMTFNVGNLIGNIFTNNYLMQAVGIPQIVGIWFLKLGRRPAIASSFLLAAFFSGILPFFAAYEINVAVTVMGMLGKFLIETNFSMIYILTAEIYPTAERVTAVGLGSSLARVGGAIAPYIVLTNQLWPNLPYVVFGVIALVAGLFAVTLPETKGKMLPDSLLEVESKNPLNSLICCKSETVDNKYSLEEKVEGVA